MNRNVLNPEIMTPDDMNREELNTEKETVTKYRRAAKKELEERNVLLTIYIRNKLRTGQRYFISKVIAEETGLDTRRIGRFMHDYPKDKTGFVIEPWGGCSHTVWKITMTSENEKRIVPGETELKPCEREKSEV